MKKLTGFIAASALLYLITGPAVAGMSKTADTGEEATPQSLFAPDNSAGPAGIYTFLERFAGFGILDPSLKDSPDQTIANAPSISETTLLSAFMKAGSPMDAYYSGTGTDNQNSIVALSQATAFAVAPNGDRFFLPAYGLAAVTQGYFVGSGAVTSAADIAPIQANASSPSVIQAAAPQGVPLPLPFLLTGSGLAMLLALRKRTVIQLKLAGNF
jgi:hypothetical protein